MINKTLNKIIQFFCNHECIKLDKIKEKENTVCTYIWKCKQCGKILLKHDVQK